MTKTIYYFDSKPLVVLKKWESFMRWFVYFYNKDKFTLEKNEKGLKLPH